MGEVVNINLDSKDVLHSFWIPKLAGKVDLVPGNNNFMWIQADEAGEYLGQCAEFCGEAHALMKFRVVAESQGDFDAWLAGEAVAAEDPVDPLAQQGKALFEGSKAQCWSCHSVTGSSKSRGQTGPNLTHVSSRSHIAAGRDRQQPGESAAVAGGTRRRSSREPSCTGTRRYTTTLRTSSPTPTWRRWWPICRRWTRGGAEGWRLYRL